MRPLASSASSPGVHDVARLLVAEEHLRARADPFHRPAELLRRVEQRAVFRIGVEAHAEAAADFLGDHAHLFRRHAEHRRELPAHRPDALRGAVQVVQVLARDRRNPWRRAAPSDCRPRASDRRAASRPCAAFANAASVAASSPPSKSSTRLPGAPACSCGAPWASASAAVVTAGRSFVLDDDRFGGVLRLRRGLGDDQRDRFADMAHALHARATGAGPDAARSRRSI